VLVMVILCTVLAMSAPSLRGWGRGSALRDAADQFLAMTRLARTQAISTAQWHRLCIDPSGGYYLAVRQGEAFLPITAGAGKPVQLPADVRLDLVKAPTPATLTEEESPQCIDFFPTGRTQPARVRLYDAVGAYEIACFSPAETFQLVQAGGGM
jgi:Tfp pilus assembly protein FimT